MSPDFATLIFLSAAIDAAAALTVLLAPSARITLPRAILAASAAAFAWLTKLVILTASLDLGPFAWVALTYADAAIAVPLVGLVLLIVGSRREDNGRRRATIPVLLLAAASLAPAPLAIWASLIEPRRIEITNLAIPIDHARAGHGSITIAVLADIQTPRITDYEASIAASVNTLAPDVIIIPGDLFQPHMDIHARPTPPWSEQRDAFRDFLASLNAPHGIYFVPGNTEISYDWRSVIKSAGVTDLTNRTISLNITDDDTDRALVLAGTEWNDASPAAVDTRSSLEAIDDRPIVIYATHNPDGVMRLKPNARPDLSIAGHTHGGQIRLPAIGALLNVTHLTPRSIASGGTHSHNHNLIHVPRGIGHERAHAPPLRLLCRPELTLITFTDE